MSMIYKPYCQKPPTSIMRHKYFIISIVFCMFLWIEFLLFIDLRSYDRHEVQGWTPEISREIVDYIKPNEHTTLFSPPLLCKSSAPILLLIIVCSSAKNFKERQIIRETWGNTKRFNYPMFESLHGFHNDNYLNINHKDWSIYVEVISL